jgi:C-terminal processing protease CtpA/Prc
MEQRVSSQMLEQNQNKEMMEMQWELYWEPRFSHTGLTFDDFCGTFKGLEEGDLLIHEAPDTPPSEPNDLRFDGDIYVLTSPFTFSGGMILASAFKDNGIGAIVGEETGDWPTGYTSLYGITLPNSGIWVGCSQWHHARPSGKDTGRGVIPDYEVKPQPRDLITGEDRTLNFVLEKLIGINYQDNIEVKK